MASGRIFLVRPGVFYGLLVFALSSIVFLALCNVASFVFRYNCPVLPSERLELTSEDLRRSDALLEEFIREKVVLPAPKDVPYNLTRPETVEQSEGQIKVIKELFKNEVYMVIITIYHLSVHSVAL